MQSFLGSLNCCSRFIKDFAIYASVLCELREADFHEIRRIDEAESSTRNGNRAYYRKFRGGPGPNRNGATGADPKFSGAARGDRTVTVLQGAIQRFPVLLGAILPAQTEADGIRRLFRSLC